MQGNGRVWPNLRNLPGSCGTMHLVNQGDRRRATRSVWFLPYAAGEPTLVTFPLLSLEIAVIARVSSGSLGRQWETPGSYLLVDPTTDDGVTGMYVGKATQLRTRIKAHVMQKERWRRAVLIRQTTSGFNSAESGWLEGRLHQHLLAPYVILSNHQHPSDETVDEHERLALQQIVEPVLGVLRAVGVNPDHPKNKKKPKQAKAALASIAKSPSTALVSRV